MEKIRLDKWLWAARLFRTRAKAKEAIDGGKVHLGGVRAKASKEVAVGDELKVRQGYDERTLVIKGLSDQRRGAPEAQQLFEETQDSIQKRLHEAEERKMAGAYVVTEGRPSKKDRRQLHDFKNKNLS